MSYRVEFAVLGPLEVRVEGRPVHVPGRRQRALLAALLLSPGTVVPLDRLIDEVFGEVPPGQARNALQTYVARLRSALGPAAGLIVTRPPGYLLDVPARRSTPSGSPTWPRARGMPRAQSRRSGFLSRRWHCGGARRSPNSAGPSRAGQRCGWTGCG